MSKSSFQHLECPIRDYSLVDWGLLYYNLAFVVQFAFAYVCTMTYVKFTSGAVFAQGNRVYFIMCPSFSTTLL